MDCTGKERSYVDRKRSTSKYQEKRRGAASAIRRRATRPAQWSKRPDPSQETLRDGN